jgi:prepilin-type processing-associated H-X9-DG protein
MDENLVGYLLDALEPEERRAVEEHLRADPEARVRLQRLRSLMQPLGCDVGPVEVPAELWVRTLGRVAEYSCRSLPAVPAAPTARPTVPIRSWWRRADVLVAACLLVCATLLIPPGLVYLRYQHNKLACQENLRELYTALDGYSRDHSGYMPNVATAVSPPRNVAGLYVVMLRENGLLPGEAHVHCPPQDSAPLPPASRAEVENMAQTEFERCISQMAEECYAYSLGYRDTWGAHSLRRDPLFADNPYLAILADRPPKDVAIGGKGNSPNHGGRGQNVLFLDGHCRFCTTRTVGVENDDIYVNYDGKVSAGKCRDDSVLGAGDARP